MQLAFFRLSTTTKLISGVPSTPKIRRNVGVPLKSTLTATTWQAKEPTENVDQAGDFFAILKSIFFIW